MKKHLDVPFEVKVLDESDQEGVFEATARPSGMRIWAVTSSPGSLQEDIGRSGKLKRDAPGNRK